MNRWLKWFVVIGIICLGIWYFLLKDYQYQVSFNTNEPPAVMFKHILDWDSYKRDNEEISLIDKQKYSEIVQSLNYGDSSFVYKWRLKRNPDGGTKITAYISDTRNKFIQQLTVPFGANDFVHRSIKNVKDVANAQKLIAETYNVHSISDTTIQQKYCAYLPLRSSINDKAPAMLQGIALIMEYIKGNEIELTGDPFLQVTEWDEEQEMISFDFCFPIKQMDSMPPHPSVLLKTTETVEGIKAEFNGNYRDSEVAWYYLLDHANEKGIDVISKPLEIYQNDPHAGGDPLTWKAQVFLPLND